jgi:DNA-binding response OmpR family regulator
MTTTALGASLNIPVSEPRPAIAGQILVVEHNGALDKGLLLERGADDYATIPFSPRKLVARLSTLMRRASRVGPENLHVYEIVRS